MKKFIDIYIPTETCNLRCHYCYIALLEKFSNKIIPIGHSAQEIRNALSLKRLGGPCMINICAGGETLISDDILPIVRELLLEGHYVMLVTNGTLKKRFDEVVTWQNQIKQRLFFKFSLHYLELKRLNLLETFADNVNKVWQAGCSITVEVTTNDKLIPYIPELKEFCLEKFGALCHLTIARDDRKKGKDLLTELSYEEYLNTWSEFESDLFNYKINLYGKKRKEFCYAGAWSYYINLATGDVKQCYCGSVIDNIYLKPENRIREISIGNRCTLPYCYNGHAFMAFGNIPHLDDQVFADERNRVTEQGKEWLQPEMKEFMKKKLFEFNHEYSKGEQINNEVKRLQCIPFLVKKIVKKR